MSYNVEDREGLEGEMLGGGSVLNTGVIKYVWEAHICKKPLPIKNGTLSVKLRYAVAEWYGAGLCDREVAGSTPARGCCVPTPTQRAIPPGSVNKYQRKRGLNGHITRCTSPVSVVLQLRLVSGWGLQETEISAALWALEARERTLLLLICKIIVSI